MTAIQDLQRNLTEVINSVQDFSKLLKIKSCVEKVVGINSKESTSKWSEAVLTMNSDDVETQFERQGVKRLSFEELLPFISDDEDEFSLKELIAAL